MAQAPREFRSGGPPAVPSVVLVSSRAGSAGVGLSFEYGTRKKTLSASLLMAHLQPD